MAAADFPNAPTVGDKFTVGTRDYYWDGAAWTAKVVLNIGAAPDLSTIAKITDEEKKIAAIVGGVSHEASAISLSNAPPASPVADEFYIVGPSPTGAFAGKANNIAVWDGKAWQFSAPQRGQAHYVQATKETLSWDGTKWVKIEDRHAAQIVLMTQDEYTTLATKDPKIVYCIWKDADPNYKPPVVTPPAGPAHGSRVTSVEIVNAGPAYPGLIRNAWTNAYNFKTQTGVIVKGTVHVDASGHIDTVNIYLAFGTVSVGDMLTCDDFGGLSVRITGVA